MKKWILVLFLFVWAFALAGCGKDDTYKIKITVPAGSTADFVYSEEEIAATGKTITVSAGEGLGDTEVILHPVEETITAGYVATHLAPGAPVTFDAEKGQWFKIGIFMQNDTNTDRAVYVEVEGVEVRIA